MSKYRFLWFQIPISGDFFQWLPAPSSVENTISQPYFFQNLETPYWKSSFPIHRQILAITTSWPVCENNSTDLVQFNDTGDVISFLSLKWKISAIWLGETACMFLIFLIATVKILKECETRES